MTQDYTCRIETLVPPAEAYEKIARVSEWWAKNFQGSAKDLGDTFTVRFGETFVDFTVVEAIPGRTVVWQVTGCNLHWLQDKTEWNGTDVAWDISSRDGTTTVTMTHRGLTPTAECFLACEKGWNNFVQKSLLLLINEGHGMPD